MAAAVSGRTQPAPHACAHRGSHRGDHRGGGLNCDGDDPEQGLFFIPVGTTSGVRAAVLDTIDPDLNMPGISALRWGGERTSWAENAMKTVAWYLSGLSDSGPFQRISGLILICPCVFFCTEDHEKCIIGHNHFWLADYNY